jgi:hypothetical protein
MTVYNVENIAMRGSALDNAADETRDSLPHLFDIF